MPVNRMNREEFFGKLTGLDEERLKKALWNLHWRGNATLRERIEIELEPVAPKRTSTPPAVPPAVLDEVHEFVALVRSGGSLSPTTTLTLSIRPAGGGISNATNGREIWPSGTACYWPGFLTTTPMTGSTR